MPVDAPALEVLFSPAEYAALPERDLQHTVCVVFDILRATSTIVTALAHGAAAVIPVAEIGEALEWKRREPRVLLAGERHGLRITAGLAGGTEFDLGNSPREFTPERVRDRTIVLTTTNGSRALRACRGAGLLLAGSLLNLRATADHLQTSAVENLLLVCSGTQAQAAYEDVLAAGALASLVWPADERRVADSARIARLIYLQHQHNLADAMPHSRNGRRLLEIPELRDDVAWCLRRDAFPIVARLDADDQLVVPGKPGPG